MKCINCGRENKQGAQFCAGCGTPLPDNSTFASQNAKQIKKGQRRRNKLLAVLIIIWLLVLAVGIALALSRCEAGEVLEQKIFHKTNEEESPSMQVSEEEDLAQQTEPEGDNTREESQSEDEPEQSETKSSPKVIEPVGAGATEYEPEESEAQVQPKPAAEPKSQTTTPTREKELSLRELNVFLSNFSEAFVGNFHPKQENGYDLLRFVLVHYMINDFDKITTINENEMTYFCISKETVDHCLSRFFGVSLTPKDYAPADGSVFSFYFRDGNYLFPAAWGESYNQFTVVSDVNAQADGTNLVHYGVYALDIETYFDIGIPNELYNYTTDTIQNCGYEVERIETGTAVIKGDLTEDNSLNWRLLDLTAE